MDYGKVLSRAWQITWRWKILWVLGFLAALGSGGFNFNYDFRYLFSGTDLRGWSWPGTGPWSWPTAWPGGGPTAWPAIILGIVALALLIGLTLWVISIFAHGGLIAGVRQVEEEGSTSFKRAWRAGAARFWSLLVVRLIFFLVGLALGVLFLLAIVAIALAMGVRVGLASGAPGGILGALLGGLACCFVPACCVLVLVVAFIALIQTYADRAIVLENKGAIDGLVRAWNVFRKNLGPSLLLLLIFFGIGLGVGIAVGLVLLLIAVPIIVVLTTTSPALWWIVPIIGGGLLLLVLGAFLNSVITTFISAGWTLAYRQMAGLVPEPAAPPPAVPAPPAPEEAPPPPENVPPPA
jgi:hypothetical protein